MRENGGRAARHGPGEGQAGRGDRGLAAAREVEPAVVALGFAMRAKAVNHKSLPAPEALSVTVSDEHGAVDWHCHGSPHRKDIKGYSLEAGDPAKPESFKQAAFSSKSKGTAAGLPSGVLTGFRVVIVGTDERAEQRGDHLRALTGAPAVPEELGGTHSLASSFRAEHTRARAALGLAPSRAVVLLLPP